MSMTVSFPAGQPSRRVVEFVFRHDFRSFRDDCTQFDRSHGGTVIQLGTRDDAPDYEMLFSLDRVEIRPLRVYEILRLRFFHVQSHSELMSDA